MMQFMEAVLTDAVKHYLWYQSKPFWLKQHHVTKHGIISSD